MQRLVRILSLVVASWFMLAAAPSLPSLEAPVVDQGAMLSPELRARLNEVLRQLWQQGGSQVAVVTLPDLGGQSIEQVSISLAERWRLGEQKRDNGVLFIIAKAERKLRIEVGQGLEGDLPDAYAKRIIDEAVVPLFREGRIDDGILVGVHEILKRTDANFSFSSALGEGQQELASHRRQATTSEPFGFVLVLLFFLFYVMFVAGGRGPRGGRGGHTWSGGGGFSSRGGGGGGFSGGGGGFSGGGASGSW